MRAAITVQAGLGIDAQPLVAAIGHQIFRRCQTGPERLEPRQKHGGLDHRHTSLRTELRQFGPERCHTRCRRRLITREIMQPLQPGGQCWCVAIKLMEKGRHACRHDGRQRAVMHGQTLKQEPPFERIAQQGWRHVRPLEGDGAENDGVGRDCKGQMKTRRKIENDPIRQALQVRSVERSQQTIRHFFCKHAAPSCHEEAAL